MRIEDKICCFDKVTVKDAFEFLKKRKFKYKGRLITQRTIKTMCENGSFETLEKCGCGRTNYIYTDELVKLIDEQDKDN